MKIFSILENEINNYLQGEVPISEGYNFSQHKITKRIILYLNGIYPEGKLDSQGDYKYWFDIITPRINNEVKNIDFDTKDILFYSEQKKDIFPILLLNANLKEWLRETGQAEEINEAVEEGSALGNIVFKKVNERYERVDLKNFFVINQTAKNLEETPVIERHILTQSELRAKKNIWENVDEVIKNCANKYFSATLKTNIEVKETPYYEIFERNGEVDEATLFEAQGKEGGNRDKYILAKIIVAGLKKGQVAKSCVLYADEISKIPYKEYHRESYTGRWFRKGIVEILMDIQTRANEIGNQIAKGLAWASKTIFRSADRLIVQNILTDMESGDIIKTTDLSQIPVRMQGLDQLIADWNRLMDLADKLCHSYDIARGETMPAGTPFRLGAILNINVSKFFDFIREKLGIVIENIFQEWILPELIKDLKKKDVLRLTGNSEYLTKYYEMCVNAWYVRNLIALGPHSAEEAELVKSRKLEEISKQPEALVKLEKGLFDNVKPRVKVIITGENVNITAELETLYSFIQLEQDPVRRQALIEMAMAKKGIDISMLPKTEVEMLSAMGPASTTGGKAIKRTLPLPV